MSSKTRKTETKERRKPALVPKLRFPEFREAEGWEEKPLSACLDYQQPTPYLVADTNYNPEFKTPVLTAGKTFILGYTSEQHGIFNEGLPVIIFDDFTTASQFVDFPFKAKSSAMKILQAKNGADIKFMYETLQTLSYEVGAHERHWISNFSPMLVSVPKPPEQQKIAECLSSLDEVIAAQARKLDALKTHKKGLMQQLFPREGETQPRLRFPEFQGAGEWKPDTLENLCTAKISYGIVQAGPHVPNGMPYIKSMDLNSLLRLNRLDRTSDVIAKKYQRSEVVPGDLVFSLRGDIGVSQVVPKEIPVANLTQGTARIRTKGPSLFFLHALRSQPVHSRILAVSKGSTFQEIALEHLRQIQVIHPKEDEQQRIAACLSTHDDLIAAGTQKLEVLKTHKRGLMQHLFPSRRRWRDE
jgi:type I restriction enzyme S subunit